MPISELTGEEMDANSPDWRHECEVRMLLDRLPSAQARRNYVNGVVEKQPGGKGRPAIDRVIEKGVRQRRGDAAADKIIEDLRKLHALRIARAQTASTQAATGQPGETQ